MLLRAAQDVAEGRMGRVQINDMGLNLRNLLLSTKVHYLEDAIKLVADADADGDGRAAQRSERYKSMCERYKTNPAAHAGVVGQQEQALLCALVAALHAADPDLGHAVMVFLPSYKTLELQHELLLAKGAGSNPGRDVGVNIGREWKGREWSGGYIGREWKRQASVPPSSTTGHLRP